MTTAVASLLALALASAAAAAAPEAPRARVDTDYPSGGGAVVEVGAGDDLQAALDAAQPGDVLALQPGAVFRGSFVLRAKRGEGWIVVKSADPDGRLPQPGVRVGPADAVAMPALESRRGSVLRTAPGAHHYRFVGLEIRPAPGAFLHNLVYLDPGGDRPDGVPHHIVFDRCYIHGDPAAGGRRGIALNSAHTAVIDSYLSDFKEVGADSQAIAGWNGPGPFKLVNNYLEGAGENVMFGGADPAIRGLVPADIEIRGNHFAKPAAWRSDDPAYAGTPWTVKNLFELKNARRVLIDGNLFEHNWTHGQDGTAILFTVRNQDGAAPWSVVEDVAFTNNVVRRVANGMKILGQDDIHESAPTRRILIENNLFEDVGGRWGRGVFLSMFDGAADVVVRRNTIEQTDSILIGEGRAHTGFVFSGNVVPHNDYGITGTGTAYGKPTLARYFPGAVVTDNVIVGGPQRRYPAGNAFPAVRTEHGRAAGVDRAGLCRALHAHARDPAALSAACRGAAKR